MKRLLLLLLLSVPSFAACSITVFVSGTPILSAPVNANFASLNTCKPQVFSGTTLPGNIAGSKLGDLYLNTASGLSYQCFKTSGVCTAVAAANWVQIGGSGGGGTGTVTVVSSGSLTSTACVTGGGTTTIQTGTGCTISSTGDMTAHSFASSDTTHSGGTLYSGLTSGAVMLAAADIAGTAIVYVLPSTNGTAGQFLKDNGVVACPTLASGSPSVCHQLTWATGSGGATIPSTTSALRGDGAGNASAVTGTGTDCVLVNGSSGACGGGGGSGTVTSVGLTGTANQITVTGSSPITTSGSFALSIPTNPTLPGTTTGTFSGNLTGTVTGHATLDAPIASPTFTGTVTIPNGGVFGTPTSMTATNVTGLPIGGITGLGTGVATALAANVSGSGAICLATGSACSGGGSGITVGTTTITSGADTKVLFNNAGVVGEYTISGTGSVCMSSGSACSGGGSGGLTLVEQHTASSSATLSLTSCFTSTYDDYIVRLVDLVPSSTGADLQFLASTNGGSSYLAGSTYEQVTVNNSTSNAGLTSAGSVGTAVLTFFPNVDAGVEFVGASANINFYNPLGTVLNKSFDWSGHFGLQAAPRKYFQQGTGFIDNSSAINAIRFQFSSGNIASGTIRCYGVAK